MQQLSSQSAGVAQGCKSQAKRLTYYYLNTVYAERMQRVSVKLDEDMVEQLDSLADDQSVTRSDVIRDTLDDGLNTDDDVKIQRLQERITDLETENERLRREKRLVLEHTELVNTVKEEQSLAKRKAEAGLWTKTKWTLFGMSDED